MTSNQNRTQALFEKLQQVSRLSSGARPEVVHQLRTTIRRIETVVGARPEPGRNEKKLLKQLRRLRRRAGKVRDLDVQIEALRSLGLEGITRDRARVMPSSPKIRRASIDTSRSRHLRARRRSQRGCFKSFF